MKIAKYVLPDGQSGIAVAGSDDTFRSVSLSAGERLQDLLEAPDLETRVRNWVAAEDGVAIPLSALQAPIDQQEVWAAGVTYRRSQTARMEESEAAASCYDRVYTSDRPELFLKATPHRVVGPGQAVRIRSDSHWNVPEPELTLVLNSQLQLVGYTIGNDMSSRDIEGDNPLYLPQAKVYSASCALGPCIRLASTLGELSQVGIRLQIVRQGNEVFNGETSIAQMARTPLDLVQWLGRDNGFPDGAFLLTGTGIVPPREFTLQAGDWVAIEIDQIGSLSNPVVQG